MKQIILVVFTLTVGCLFGQNKNQKNTGATNLKPNDLDQTYTPPKNSLFDEDSKKNENSGVATVDFKNVFRFNPLLLPRSIAAIGYERTVTDYLGLEAFIGYNYKRDWIQAIGTALTGEEFSLSDSKSAIDLNTMLINGGFYSGGLFSSIGFKIYFDGTPYEGSYFGIQSRFNNYTIDLGNASNNVSYSFASATDNLTKINNVTTLFMWGTSYVGGSSKVPVIHDFYTGVGIRNSSYDVYAQKTITDENGYTSTSSTYYKTNQRESVIGFSYVVGYSFGFGLRPKKSL